MTVTDLTARIAAKVPDVPPPPPGQPSDRQALPDGSARVTGEVVGQFPDDWWKARPYRGHIRQGAWAQGCAPESAYVACLARWGAVNPHNLQLPAHVGQICTMSLIGALVGGPAAGKGTAARVAHGLIDRGDILKPEHDNVPPGSGQGLAEILMGKVDELDEITRVSKKVRKQAHHNVFCYFDEGEILAMHMNPKSESYLPSTLKSIFSGAELGQANANEDRKRVIPALSHVYGILLGIQPGKCRPIFADTAGGLPQRFLWASAETPIPDPDIEGWPEWPGPLVLPRIPDGVPGIPWALTVDPEIAAQIRRNHYRRRQPGNTCHELDKHRDLVRLKVAGLEALMDGRRTVTVEDWDDAGTVLDASDTVRTHVLGHLKQEDQRAEEASNQKAGRRKVTERRAEDEDDISRCSRKIANKIHAQPGRWSPSALRRDLGTRWRDAYEEALARAEEKGWVVTKTEPGQGNDKVRLHPGPKRP